MTADEKGYVQFLCSWERAAPRAGPEVEALRSWRDRLRRLGLMGEYPDGISFGNLSCRTPGGDTFLISGTDTGRFEALGPEHFTEVLGWDLARNSLSCRGPVQASSESLSHAAVYESDPDARAVIHVHHGSLWERLYGRIPTTDPSAPAGTPELAWVIAHLLRETDLRGGGLFVMGGHREGLIAFDRTLEEAGERILAAYERYDEQP